MAALKELLPPSKSSGTTYYDHSNDLWFKQQLCSSSEAEQSAVIKFNPVPPYLKRAASVCPGKLRILGIGMHFRRFMLLGTLLVWEVISLPSLSRRFCL